MRRRNPIRSRPPQPVSRASTANVDARLAWALGSLLVLLLAAATTLAQEPTSKPTDVTIQGHVYKPVQLQPTDENLAKVKVPSGFKLAKFAEGLKNPRMLAVADNGDVYVTRRDLGDVLLLRDADNDGKADEQRVVARRPQLHGIAIDGNTMYLATVREVYKTDIRSDGSLGELSRIIHDLPDGGQHPNRTLAIGPDGMLYISVGSTCNACDETNPESATVLRGKPDGSSRTIFASGLRNTIGFDWHPQTKQLWGVDHGIDWLGDDEQKEELNLLEEGKQYGWPYIYADGKENPQDKPPGGVSMETWKKMSTEPAQLYTAHSAPMQMTFYTGSMFPQEYRSDAFVAMRGSWNRKPPSGYEIVRVHFDDDGKPTKIEPFITGFVMEHEDAHGYLGRLAGVAVAKDGALLVSDDSNGVIYRISHDKSGAAAR